MRRSCAPGRLPCRFFRDGRCNPYTFRSISGPSFTEIGYGTACALERAIEVARTGGPVEGAKAANGTAGLILGQKQNKIGHEWTQINTNRTNKFFAYSCAFVFICG
jgi:hypothetical protein